MDCSVSLSPSQFRRFGDELAAISGQSEWLVNYSDYTLDFTGSGNIKIQCRHCNEKFVTEFSVQSRFKILSSENEVRKHYDFFNTNIEIISAEKDCSFLDLLEDELILGNYSIADNHMCRSTDQKGKKFLYKKNNEKACAYRPFEVLGVLMNK
ncbi:hypothetical protein N9V13_04535 [Betaproteobacteria bacterium]|nr:hypothetical protein [Betaproteobacteria bacterium]